MSFSRAAVKGFMIPAMAVAAAMAQTPSRAEKREAKMRAEYVRLTAGLKVANLTASELKSQLGDTNLVLVDVRQDPEHKVSILPGAITTYGFSDIFRGGFPAGKRVVTYCTLGNRAGEYAELLRAKGLPVQNLAGGIMAWTFVSGPLVMADGKGGWVPTQKVHVFDRDMRDWIDPAYEAVW